VPYSWHQSPWYDECSEAFRIDKVSTGVAATPKQGIQPPEIGFFIVVIATEVDL
jgi:hypothetical protein